MANMYNELTVTPAIPASLVNGAEKDVLEKYGFSYEKVTRGEEEFFYFFAEEGLDPEPMLDLDDPVEYLHEMEQEFPKGSHDRPEWFVRLITEIEAHIKEHGEDEMIRAETLGMDTYEDIFQSILRKPGCSVESITIEGAIYCDKMRPGEFGGHATRIYPDRSVSIATPGSIDELERIAQATQNVLENWEQGDLASAVMALKATVEQSVPGYLTV